MDAIVPPKKWVITCVVAVLCAIWGSTWLVIREGLRDLPPITSAGLRFAIAALCLFVLAPIVRRREGGEKPQTWLWLTVAVTNFAVSYAIVYVCEQSLPSGLVSVLWAVFPLFMAASGHWFLPGERLRTVQWLGFVLGFGGMVVLFRTDLSRIGAGAAATGALLLVSPLVSAVGTTLMKRYGGDRSSVLINRNAMALAAGLLLALALVAERGAPIHWTPRAVFSIGYLSLIGTVTTFGLYFWVLRYASAYRMSLISYATPPIALFLGWGIAGERVTLFTLAGAALVVGGIYLVVRRPRTASQPTPSAARA